MAARGTKRQDGRYTVTITVEGRKHFFYGRTQAEAKAKRDEAQTRLLGRNELLRSGCHMTGSHLDGRIKAALSVLRSCGKVHTESGPRRAVYHYAICLL